MSEQFIYNSLRSKKIKTVLFNFSQIQRVQITILMESLKFPVDLRDTPAIKTRYAHFILLLVLAIIKHSLRQPLLILMPWMMQKLISGTTSGVEAWRIFIR